MATTQLSKMLRLRRRLRDVLQAISENQGIIGSNEIAENMMLILPIEEIYLIAKKIEPHLEDYKMLIN